MAVTTARVFRRDVVVMKGLPAGVVPSQYGRAGESKEGGAIKEFSERSRYRLLHTIKNCDCDFHSMLTLTYPSDFPTDGKAVKRDFNALRKRLLRRFPAIQGVWFLEFQKRGAPHFHVMLTLALGDHGALEERTRRTRKQRLRTYQTESALHEMVSGWWYEIVGSGDTRHLAAGCAWEVIRNDDGACRYGAAHASKPTQKTVPDGFRDVGRFWGVIGKVTVTEKKRLALDTAEVFCRVGVDAMSNQGRIKKYLWDSARKFDDEKPIAAGQEWRAPNM